jgi:glutaminase
MPAKSGVGGGIIAVLPGRFGIGIFSPPLDANGNSVRGIAACKQISADFGLNVFSRTSPPSLAVRRINNETASSMRRRPRHAGEDVAHADASGRIKTLCLQGEIGVDGAEYLIRQLQQLASTTDSFILDMYLVKNLSPTAARLLHQARTELHAEGIAVVLSRVRGRGDIEAVLARVRDGTRGFLAFGDNNLALQWCLNRLQRRPAEAEATECQTGDSSFFAGISADMMKRLIAVMPERKFAAGESILESGELSDGRIFFIERGSVHVLAPLDGVGYQSICTLTPGMYFGEMALLGQAARTASIHADVETHCRVLTVDDLNRLSREMPDLKVAILENLSRDLATSLKETTRLVSVLAT